MADAKLMRDAGEAAFQAARSRSVDALANLNETVYRSCTTCHQHYRKNYGRRP
jgi:cytochrome c556